jgi:uncharacterized cupin superfamily protein
LEPEREPASHVFMHRTRTIDFGVVLSGEIVMVLDASEVTVKAGDIVVQRGTSHAWVNRSAATCRIAFTLIDAKAYPQPADHAWPAG